MGTQPWFLYGATFYDAGFTPALVGIDAPQATVGLALRAHLNTIRIVNFFSPGDFSPTAAYTPSMWSRVDTLIADASAARLHVELDLSDYRNMLWQECVNPYATDWSSYLAFVSNRRNTVTGALYRDDPTIAVVAVAGEPLPPGRHVYTAGGRTCDLAYSGAQLTGFFTRTLKETRAAFTDALVTTGGLGYLDFNSGIDWKVIFGLADNQLCDIKTYGGMLRFLSTMAAWCASLHKPLIDEEFGWPQSTGDGARAGLLRQTLLDLYRVGAAGAAYWNVGFEVTPRSYDIGPSTPGALDVIASAGRSGG